MNGGFLFDTNILSELMRPRPEPRVQNWVAAQDLGALFLSVVCIGELAVGFTTMQCRASSPVGGFVERHLRLLFPGRVLPGDAGHCGTVGPTGRNASWRGGP